MESVGQNYGFLLYRTQIPQKFANTNVELEILGLRDRGIILVGQVRELFLFIINFVRAWKRSHINLVQWVGENPRNEVALTSPFWKQEGNWAELTDFRKDLWDWYKPKEKFRPFSSYPGLLFQSEARCKAVGMKMMFLIQYANETHFYKKGFASSLVLKGSFENSKVACCPIVADSWTIRTIPDVDGTENTWTPLLHFISSYCRSLQNNIIWTWNYQI